MFRSTPVYLASACTSQRTQSVTLLNFNQNWDVSTNFSQSPKYEIFKKICQVGDLLPHIDKWTGMMRPIIISATDT